MTIFNVVQQFSFGCLCLTLLSFAQVQHLPIWKRMENGVIPVSSSDLSTHEAATLLLRLSQPDSKQSPEEYPSKHDEEMSKARGKKRKEMTLDEIRLRKNEINRLSIQRKKEKYENRFKLPPEERKRIELAHEENTQKRRQYRSKRNKAMFERIRKGKGTETDLQEYEKKKASANFVQKQRNQRIKEGTASEEDVKIYEKNLNYFRKFRKENRQLCNSYTIKSRAKKREKNNKSQTDLPGKRANDKLLDLNRIPSPEPVYPEEGLIHLRPTSTGQPHIPSTDPSQELAANKRERAKRYSLQGDQKRLRRNELARERYKVGKDKFHDLLRLGLSIIEEEDKDATAFQRKMEIQSKRSKAIWSRLRAGNPTEKDRKEYSRHQKNAKNWRQAHLHTVQQRENERRRIKRRLLKEQNTQHVKTIPQIQD